MRWVGNMERVEESRGVYRDLVRHREGKRQLGRPRRRWEFNIKMDLQDWDAVKGHDRSGSG